MKNKLACSIFNHVMDFKICSSIFIYGEHDDWLIVQGTCATSYFQWRIVNKSFLDEWFIPSLRISSAFSLCVLIFKFYFDKFNIFLIFEFCVPVAVVRSNFWCKVFFSSNWVKIGDYRMRWHLIINVFETLFLFIVCT